MSYKATTLSSFGLALLAIEVDGPSAPPGGTTTPPLVDALGVRIVDADAKGVDDLGVEEGASPKDEHHVQEGESEGRGRRDRPGESEGRVDTSGISECGGASTSPSAALMMVLSATSSSVT